MGVLARMVVTSYVSVWYITSEMASNPSCKNYPRQEKKHGGAVCEILPQLKLV
jgi:hypothetical protein